LGTVSGLAFSLRRAPRDFVNSLLIVQGDIEPTEDGGSLVTGELTLRPQVSLFSTFICLLMVFSALFAPWDLELARWACPLFVIGFVACFSRLAFVLEGFRIKDILADLLRSNRVANDISGFID